MIEIKYDNSKEHLLRIHECIQKRKLKDKIKNKVDFIKKLYNVTDYDISTTIYKAASKFEKYSIDFNDITNEVSIDCLNYDELNTIYNLLEAFEKDLDEMEEN